MRDDHDVPLGGGEAQRLRDRRDDPPLRVRRAFPAAHAFLRAREERVRHRLELGLWQVAGGGTIVFPKGFQHDGDQAQARGEGVGGLARLALGAGKHRARGLQPGSFRDQPGTFQAQGGKTPVRHGDGGIDRHLRVGEKTHDAHGGPSWLSHTPRQTLGGRKGKPIPGSGDRAPVKIS